jgi:ribonuclease HII
MTNQSEIFPSEFKEQELIAGIDEVGRGCLAGPVVAGAVILPDKDFSKSGIIDSKALTAAKREKLYDFICQNALCFSIGSIDNEGIDEINILQATVKAMHQAIEKLNPKPDLLLIDGNYFRGNGITYKTIIRGDATHVVISAASIIAKVSRDRWMSTTAEALYPEYGFARHKGYATKQHIEAIRKHGLCQIHRKSFTIPGLT